MKWELQRDYQTTDMNGQGFLAHVKEEERMPDSVSQRKQGFSLSRFGDGTILSCYPNLEVYDPSFMVWWLVLCPNLPLKLNRNFSKPGQQHFPVTKGLYRIILSSKTAKGTTAMGIKFTSISFQEGRLHVRFWRACGLSIIPFSIPFPFAKHQVSIPPSVVNSYFYWIIVQ